MNSTTTTLSVNSFTSIATYKSSSQLSCEVPSLAQHSDDGIRDLANMSSGKVLSAQKETSLRLS